MLDNIPIPELNLTTVALGLFVILAAFVLLRGALRILLGTLVLSSSAWVAFRLWQMAPTLSTQWFGKPLDWLSIALPAVGFIVTFLVGRLLLKLLASPFQKGGGEQKPLTFPRLVGGALFTLIPTVLVGAIIVTLVHHAGSIAKIETAGGRQKTDSAEQMLKTLAASIEKSIPPEWFKLLDPLSDPNRISLAKMIAAKTPLKPVIDPSTGKPIPRAIIVNDPELNHLAKQGDYADLLRSPQLTAALKDPKVQKAIKSFQQH